MYCPNCGKENSTEQNFCRSCGLRLEKISEDLLVQVPSARSMELARRDRTIQKLGRVGIVGVGSLGLTGMAAAAYQIITTMILTGKNVLGGAFVLAFMAFAIPTLAYAIYMRSRRGRPRLRASETGTWRDPETPSELPAETTRIEPPSITEASTRRLE